MRRALLGICTILSGCWFSIEDLAGDEPEEAIETNASGGASPATSSAESTVAPTSGMSSSGGEGGEPGEGGEGGAGGTGGAGGEAPQPVVVAETSCKSEVGWMGQCAGTGFFFYWSVPYDNGYCSGDLDYQQCFIQDCASDCVAHIVDGGDCGAHCLNDNAVDTDSCDALAPGGTPACAAGDSLVLRKVTNDCLIKDCGAAGATCKPGNDGVVDCYD
ncbi:MAG: hypothetical protein HOV80_31000 [Polyangiaceae bacterium]|nr:hypothetical protein [Polyangiaceae bacterium]